MIYLLVLAGFGVAGYLTAAGALMMGHVFKEHDRQLRDQMVPDEELAGELEKLPGPADRQAEDWSVFEHELLPAGR